MAYPDWEAMASTNEPLEKDWEKIPDNSMALSSYGSLRFSTVHFEAQFSWSAAFTLQSSLLYFLGVEINLTLGRGGYSLSTEQTTRAEERRRSSHTHTHNKTLKCAVSDALEQFESLPIQRKKQTSFTKPSLMIT